MGEHLEKLSNFQENVDDNENSLVGVQRAEKEIHDLTNKRLHRQRKRVVNKASSCPPIYSQGRVMIT